MSQAATAAANGSAGAAEAGELIRTTGERVEAGFWTTVNDVLLKIPEIIGFVVALVAAWLLGKLLARIIFRRFHRRGRSDLGRLLGAVAIGTSVLVVGLFAMLLLFPRIDPTSVLSLLGFGSIAIGFAFKDILQNLVAGIILLIREPYRTGDEIIVGDGDYEGVVEEVEMRATHIRTIDRRMVVIPNTMIFTNAITVNTDSDYRTANLTLSIAYGDDPRRAMEIIREAVKSAKGVAEAPEPAVAIQSLSDYAIDLFIVFGAGPTALEQITAKGAVLLAIHDACRDNDIVLPFPTQVNLVRSADESRGPDKLDGPQA